MNILLSILFCFLIFTIQIQDSFSGPAAGGSCCAICCTPLMLAGGIGGLACLATCVASMGAAPPCFICAAAFLAPTP
jgi:hypothetical protein